jgi:hypothetical protein
MLKTLDKLVASIVTRHLEEHGHGMASLALRWPGLVGQEIAEISRPLKLQQFKRRGLMEQQLTIAAPDSASAFRLRLWEGVIRERLAQALGYSVVSGIRIETAPRYFPEAGAARSSVPAWREDPPEDAPLLPLEEADLMDPALRVSLERLGRWIAARSKSARSESVPEPHKNFQKN